MAALAGLSSGCAASSDSQPTLQIGAVAGENDAALGTLDGNSESDANGVAADASGGLQDAEGVDSGGAQADSVPIDGPAADVQAADAAPDAAPDSAVAEPDAAPDSAPLDAAPDSAPQDAGLADAAPPSDVPVVADVVAVQDAQDAASPPDSAVPPDAVVAVDVVVVVDAGPPPAVCGNGICQSPGETAQSCPADCAVGWESCAAAKCQAAVTACGASPSCVATTACAAKCKDVACLSACTTNLDWATLTSLLQPLAACAQQQGCLAAAPAGPSAGPSTCKNGLCDGGETHLTCPADCPFPISASELCQTQKCAQSYGACVANKGCVDAAVCWNQWFDPQKCLPNNQSGAQLSALIQCIQSNCASTAPVATCANKCGSFVKDAACQCDNQCKKYNDCCPDYGVLCGG